MQKTATILFSVLLMMVLCCVTGCSQQEKSAEVPETIQEAATQDDKGEELFNEHCIPCHREGSRLQNVHEPEDVLTAMRNPKGSMPRFEEKEITEEERKIISRFIFLKILGQE
jgi:mono/diheme cytochrome c family protein